MQDEASPSKRKMLSSRKKLSPRQKSYNARLRKEARQLKTLDEKMASTAWRDGQTIHLFDLPPEVSRSCFKAGSQWRR